MAKGIIFATTVGLTSLAGGFIGNEVGESFNNTSPKVVAEAQQALADAELDVTQSNDRLNSCGWVAVGSVVDVTTDPVPDTGSNGNECLKAVEALYYAEDNRDTEKYKLDSANSTSYYDPLERFEAVGLGFFSGLVAGIVATLLGEGAIDAYRKIKRNKHNITTGS